MKTPNFKDPRKKFSLLPRSACIILPLISAAPALAQDDQSEIEQLRAQITALSQRLEQLETRDAAQQEERREQAEAAPRSSTGASWTDRVSISGDLRTRYERIDDDARPEVRNRNRIRARLAVNADVNDDWKMSFGFASGGDDPISTNQTLGDGGSTKDARLDYALFEYHGIDNTMITGGKYKNVFFKPGGQNLIFDGDYRPEGLGLKYKAGDLFFNAATIWLESDNRGGAQDTEMMWGLQLGHTTELDTGSLTYGASYYDASVKGSTPFYDFEDYRNTLDGAGQYLNNYHELELFSEYNTSVGKLPLMLFADYVRNLDADRLDTGWAVGGMIGDAGNKGGWELGYIYQDLEADAVYAALTDSDFAGGGADGKGHIIDFAYGLGTKTKAGLTWFVNEYNEARGLPLDYSRLHVYVTVGF